MTNLEAALEVAVNLYGVSDEVTLMISVKRNEELAKEQRMLNSLQDRGFLAAMVREFKKQ